MRINGFPFNHLIELRKNKEFFKKNVTVNSNTRMHVVDDKPALFNFEINPPKQKQSSEKSQILIDFNKSVDTEVINKVNEFDSKSFFESFFEKNVIIDEKDKIVDTHQSNESLTYKNIDSDLNRYPELKPLEFEKEKIVSNLFS